VILDANGKPIHRHDYETPRHLIRETVRILNDWGSFEIELRVQELRNSVAFAQWYDFKKAFNDRGVGQTVKVRLPKQFQVKA
jgi:hypothetical protein